MDFVFTERQLQRSDTSERVNMCTCGVRKPDTNDWKCRESKQKPVEVAENSMCMPEMTNADSVELLVVAIVIDDMRTLDRIVMCWARCKVNSVHGKFDRIADKLCQLLRWDFWNSSVNDVHSLSCCASHMICLGFFRELFEGVDGLMESFVLA